MSKMTKLLLSAYAISDAMEKLAHPERTWFLPETIATAIGLLAVVVISLAVYELWNMGTAA